MQVDTITETIYLHEPFVVDTGFSITETTIINRELSIDNQPQWASLVLDGTLMHDNAIPNHAVPNHAVPNHAVPNRVVSIHDNVLDSYSVVLSLSSDMHTLYQTTLPVSSSFTTITTSSSFTTVLGYSEFITTLTDNLLTVYPMMNNISTCSLLLEASDTRLASSSDQGTVLLNGTDIISVNSSCDIISRFDVSNCTEIAFTTYESFIYIVCDSMLVTLNEGTVHDVFSLLPKINRNIGYMDVTLHEHRRYLHLVTSDYLYQGFRVRVDNILSNRTIDYIADYACDIQQIMRHEDYLYVNCRGEIIYVFNINNDGNNDIPYVQLFGSKIVDGAVKFGDEHIYTIHNSTINCLVLASNWKMVGTSNTTGIHDMTLSNNFRSSVLNLNVIAPEPSHIPTTQSIPPVSITQSISTLVFCISLIVIAVILSIVARYRNKEIKDAFLLVVIAISISDLVTDVLFIARLPKEQMTVFYLSCSFLVLTMVLSMTSCFVLMRGEMSCDSFYKWYLGNQVVTVAVFALSSVNINVLNLLNSHIINKDWFKAPFKDKTVKRLKIMTLVPIFSEDIPQLFLQIISLNLTGASTVQTTVWISIIVSIISIVVSASRKAIEYLVSRRVHLRTTSIELNSCTVKDGSS